MYRRFFALLSTARLSEMFPAGYLVGITQTSKEGHIADNSRRPIALRPDSLLPNIVIRFPKSEKRPQ